MVDKQKGCWTFTVQLDGKESGVFRYFSETSGNCGEVQCGLMTEVKRSRWAFERLRMRYVYHRPGTRSLGRAPVDWSTSPNGWGVPEGVKTRQPGGRG